MCNARLYEYGDGGRRAAVHCRRFLIVSECQQGTRGVTTTHLNTQGRIYLFKCSFLLDLAFLPDLCMYEYVLGEVSMSNCIALSNTPIRSPWDWKTGGLSLMSWTKTVTGR